MAITLTTTSGLEAQGGITTNTSATGDASGQFPDITVTGIHGQALQGSGFSDGLGYRHNGTSFVLTTLLDENTTFGGDVSGSQVGGLSVIGISGKGVEISGASAGSFLRLNSTTIDAVEIIQGFTPVNNLTVNRTIADGAKEEINIGTLSAAITITGPATTTNSTEFIVDTRYSGAINTTNKVTITGSNSEVFAQNGIDASSETSVDLVGPIVVKFKYNGARYVYTVIG